MSLLKIFRPEEDANPSPSTTSFVDENEFSGTNPGENAHEPVLLNFVEHAARLRGVAQSQLHRARQIHAQCECPECRSALVVPLVLNDGRRDRSGEEVPGTSTLVGFRCDTCSTEWPA
jgi:hypothetical protein